MEKERPENKRMFRKLVRKVILEKFWREMFDSTSDEIQIRTDNGLFRRIGQKEILLLKEQQILSIPFKDRSAVRMKIAEVIVSKLKCLQLFPPNLRQKLSKCLRYVSYGKGRTVIKENYEPNVMYFILSGEISVLKCQWDVKLLKYVDCPVGVMGSGEVFGQLGLINDLPRTNTYETATACELLYILKEDFDVVLKPTLSAHLSNIRTALGRFEYFKYWSQSQLDECSILAKIVDFNPEDIIYSEDRGLLNFVFFVLSGQCEIIQYLKIRTFQKNNKTKCKLEAYSGPKRRQSRFLSITNPEEDNSVQKMLDLDKTGKLLKVYVNVGQYNRGSVFGLGEELEDRLVMAKTKVQCLLLPRYWLFQKQQNIGNIWNRTKMFLNATIPSREALFKQYSTSKKWKAFKDRMILDIAKKTGKRTTTTFLDIPIICRIENGW